MVHFTGDLKSMVFRKFRIQIIIRLAIITLAIGFLLYCLLVSGKYIRSFYSAVFIILAMVELFYYIDRTNRDVTAFLQSILNSDFTNVFDAGKKGKSFRSLYNSMNKITRKFREINRAKEIQYLYLQTLVEQANVGLISFDKNGKIQLVNRAFREIANQGPLLLNSNISELPENIFQVVNGLIPGKRELKTLEVGAKMTPLIFIATGIKTSKDEFTLISVQNIRQELDEKELEAWQKLIRVLTHEIMNSATPITSLSSSLYTLVRNQKDDPIGKKEKEKIVTGLEAIQDRSSGLMKFTQAYQSLTRIPKPRVKPILIKDLIHRIEILIKAQIEERNIKFTIRVTDDVNEIVGDIDLLDQVFLNLLKNSIEALEGKTNPSVAVSFRNTGEGKVMIAIQDNGDGMTDEIREQIFVPFFTTKEQGSGIGLSLCKQIIQLHGGMIAVESGEGQGTAITILI